MKILVGLGNPGRRYHFSPHNIGFLVIDKLAEDFKVRLTKKLRFNALTGKSVVDGQNILFGDSHVKFEKSPNAAVEQDNIYTTWGTLTDQELKRQIGVDPKDPGSGAEEPMDDEDSYLVSDEKQP